MMGGKRVDQIGSNEVLSVLQPIWLEKPETARRVKQRIKTVFDWCLAKLCRSTMNPVDTIRLALPKQSKSKGHLLPYPMLSCRRSSTI
jgi:hypothetical protein